jgi:SAM-dependent methyltransferase
MVKKEWWQDFFNKFYIEGWAPRIQDHKRTAKEISFIIKNVPINKTDKILDLCCGSGRHSLVLAKKGFIVTGIDYSDYELKIAKKEAKKNRLNVNFIKQNAILLNDKEKFDVILNLFTSFGYSSDKNNKKIIQNVSKALKKGGRFLIDVVNVDYILNNFREKNWDEVNRDGFLLEETKYNPQKGINITNWTLIDKGKILRKQNSKIRFYTYLEMKKMIENAGMKVKKVWGYFEGDKYDAKFKRMIILAFKN